MVLWNKGNRDEGTIIHVEVGFVYVSWISSVIIGQGILSSPPPHFQSPRGLALLSYFSYTNWQIGDWCKLLADFLDDLHKTAENKLPSANSTHLFYRNAEGFRNEKSRDVYDHKNQEQG